jgi:hypothetical protein
LEENMSDSILLAPKEVLAELEQGLRWHEAGLSGDGLEDQTVREARALLKGDPLSEEKANRMYRFLARTKGWKTTKGFHEGEEGYPNPARVSFALWGGEAASAWVQEALRYFTKKAVEEGLKTPIPSCFERVEEVLTKSAWGEINLQSEEFESAEFVLKDRNPARFQKIVESKILGLIERYQASSPPISPQAPPALRPALDRLVASMHRTLDALPSREEIRALSLYEQVAIHDLLGARLADFVYIGKHLLR